MRLAGLALTALVGDWLVSLEDLRLKLGESLCSVMTRSGLALLDLFCCSPTDGFLAP